MGSFRLRQGPQQRRLAGISWRSTLVGLVLGVGLIAAAPSPASAAADLSVTETAAPEPVFVGDQLTYTITVHNGDPANQATAVRVSDDLAPGLAPVSLNASQGSCASGSTVICDLGTLAAASDATVTIVVTVTPQAPTSFVNSAGVSSPDDPNPDNDSAPEVLTTVQPSANLTLAMTAVPDPVVVGDQLTFTLVVENKGPSSASGVNVTDTLPPSVAFATATAGCSESHGTVTCDVGTLGAQESATVDITVQPQAAGPITNQAVAASAVHEPDRTDNSASTDVTVSSPPSTSGGGQTSGPLKVVLTESYVLISGRSVKLVKGRYVPVSLTCAGEHACAGTMLVTTDKPVKHASKGKKKKHKRRLVRFGSKQFSIEGNRRQEVLVPVAKSKVKLLKRLRRVKARATIREIDIRGNPRISMRSFTLRAR